MEIVDDSMPLPPHPSVNIQELNSVQKLDTLMDVNQPKEELKIFPQNIYDSECHNIYIDSSPTGVNNDFIIKESSNQDRIAEVKEAHVDAGFDNVVEPSSLRFSKTRADEDIEVQFSDDVNLSEHELSALQDRCRETDGTDIKDICIDEGLPVKEKVHLEDIFKGQKHIFGDIYPVKDEEIGSKNEKVDAEWPIPLGLKSSTDAACEKDLSSCESKVFINKSGLESETKRLVLRDFLKEKVVEKPSLQNTAADVSQLKTIMGDGCKDEQDMAQEDTSTNGEVVTGKLRSSIPTSEESADDSNMETSAMKTDPEKEATNKSSLPTSVNNKDESLSHHLLPDAAHMPRRLDPSMLASEQLTTSAPVQRDHFESSFASVGHYAGSITYSGPIAHSGSLSHRSDGSTTSTRSFAFPVLQNEWNFSPIRMQKADGRQQRRHRGWMHDLFCCRY